MGWGSRNEMHVVAHSLTCSWGDLQVVEWLDAHYSNMEPQQFKKMKERFQSQDPHADIGL